MNKDWIRKEKERCCIANWLKHDMIIKYTIKSGYPNIKDIK